MTDQMAADGALAPGLRERKKQRTRETIARAALALFDRQGYQATTLAQIAEEADVAPRTVSAYFPAKEELAFPDQAEAFAQLRARLQERPPSETAAEALRAWIDAQLPEWLARERQLRVQRRLIDEDESLRAYKGRFVADAQELMVHEIARDLDASPDELEPRMAAAATIAILELLDANQDGPIEDDLVAWHANAMRLVDRAVAFVSAGVRALQAAPRE
jgi:AcrR family transcriptional regulator